MVPRAAEFIIGDDYQRIFTVPSVHDSVDEIDEMLAALRFACITGMFVLFAERLDETDRLQASGVGRGDEGGLVEQMLDAQGLTGRIIGEIVEGLMVILETLVWATQDAADNLLVGIGVGAGTCGAVGPTGPAGVALGVIPAAGIPRPIYALVVQ